MGNDAVVACGGDGVIANYWNTDIPIYSLPIEVRPAPVHKTVDKLVICHTFSVDRIGSIVFTKSSIVHLKFFFWY